MSAIPRLIRFLFVNDSGGRCPLASRWRKGGTADETLQVWPHGGSRHDLVPGAPGKQARVKLLVTILAIIWLFCGLIGAWWLDEVHLKKIALGPITLAKALDDRPVSYPGP
jgi:hypothetical protein